MMSTQEKELIKNVDDLILNSNKEKLQDIQELDKKSQLEGNSFYDVYVNSFHNKKTAKPTKPKAYSKGK